MRIKHSWTILLFFMLAGCGPNVLRAKGLVMNPLVEDSKEYAFIRMVTIVRKEPQITSEHTIVGDFRPPLALGELHEPAEIPPQHTDGNGLLLTMEIYSPYKDQLADMPKGFKFWLELEDGRKVKCRTHRLWALRNLTQSVTGGSLRPYQVIRNKKTKSVKVLRAWEEVENEYQLFWRKIRVVCTARALITMDTKKIVFVSQGHQRQRRYAFLFTTDLKVLLGAEEPGI